MNCISSHVRVWDHLDEAPGIGEHQWGIIIGVRGHFGFALHNICDGSILFPLPSILVRCVLFSIVDGVFFVLFGFHAFPSSSNLPFF